MSNKKRSVSKYDREVVLKERVNTFLVERFDLQEDDYYSRLDQQGLSELKVLLSDINNIFTMKVCLRFGEWLGRALSLSAEAQLNIRETILSTPPNANGYDIEIREPISVIAEVKCNIPINGGMVYGSAQRNGIIKDIRSLIEGKSKSSAQPDTCLKFLVLLDIPEVRGATQHLIKNLPAYQDLIAFADSDFEPVRRDKLYIVFVAHISV